MEKFNGVLRRGVGNCIVDFIAHGDTAHGDRPVGQCLGHGGNIRDYPEFFSSKGCPHAAKAGDDLIINQQDAMLVTNLPDTTEVADVRKLAVWAPLQ